MSEYERAYRNTVILLSLAACPACRAVRLLYALPMPTTDAIAGQWRACDVTYMTTRCQCGTQRHGLRAVREERVE